MIAALRRHWPEYLIEGMALGLFMVVAVLVTALFEHPASVFHKLIPNPDARRAVMGAAMGLTAIGLIYSPWGQRSGAHMNPATTLTFLFLSKITAWDAAFYIVSQFIGGVSGVLVARVLLGPIIMHPSVNYAVTIPGPAGPWVACVAEAGLACGMMFMVLCATNAPRFARYTGVYAGILVFLYVTFEAPLSGMSINPARTVASALPSGIWQYGWIYFAGPIAGMLLAARAYCLIARPVSLACPKLHHGTAQRCIFCGHRRPPPTASTEPSDSPGSDRSSL